MAIGKGRAALGPLRTLFEAGTIGDLTDGQLLERFATERGEAAELCFALLVERHGPMVMRVSRGVLADPHDAQDAFQATFLVLVRKARGLWVRDSLGPWLHQVAYRTASCARTAAARRRRHERATALLRSEGRAEVGDELARAIHEEVERLPDRQRAPVVLCDLEGCSHEQAARHLGWPIGTVKSRLSRARERLRDRLVRRGLAPNAGLLAVAPRLAGLNAPISPALVASTTGGVVRSVSARTIGRGSAAMLAREVLRSMTMIHQFKVASVLLALGVTATGVGTVAQVGTKGAGPRTDVAGETPVAAVKPGKLRVAVVESGLVEAARADDVMSEIEGRVTIVSILPEGSKVKKGQQVCELDSASLKDTLKNQEITTSQSEAAYQNAKLSRDIAELAAREYVEATYKIEWQALKGEIVSAQSAIQKAEARLARTKNARKKLVSAPTTSAEIVAELDVEDRLADAEQTLLREKMALEQAESRKDQLEKYTRQRITQGQQVDVERKRADELAKGWAWELAKSKEAKLRREIEACKILAPVDGIIVYANDPIRFDINPVQIEEGATVRERQRIFSVIDPAGPMRVNVKVHESKVDQIKRGLRARIKVDAFASETLTGVVDSVAPLPDANTLLMPVKKVYSTRVKVDKGLPGLRPGMSAEVEILLDEYDEVLSVPIKSVVFFDGSDQVAVKKPDGGFQWRSVNTGVSDGEVVVIRGGLKDGEAVALNPSVLMTEEQKRRKANPPRPDAPIVPR